MSSPRGNGSVHAPLREGGAFRPRPWRGLRLILLIAALAFLSAPPAHARGDDLEFARRLTEVGYHDLAQQVYEGVLAQEWRTAEERADAHYGIVLLAGTRARAAHDAGAPYAHVQRLFAEASKALRRFESQDPAGRYARRALLDAGTVDLTFVHWAADRLTDNAYETDGDAVRADARLALEHALACFDRLQTETGELRADAAYYHAVGLYYGARLEAPCSSAFMTALQEAGCTLEDFIMNHDGELLAVYAQNVYGIVWRELARCEDDPARRHALLDKAVEWFETCIGAEGRGPDFLAIIARGYFHLAEVARDADPSGERDFARDALLHLDAMLARHPAIWRTKDGLRAMLEHARLVSNTGRFERAVELAQVAIRRAGEADLEALERAAHRTLRDLVLAAPAGQGDASLDPAVLCLVADDLYRLGQFEEALHVYRQVIATTPRTREAFLEQRWHAWERIGWCYKRLGDRLGEALAYESVHEAWVRGLIPYEGSDTDPNMTRAADQRRRAQVAFRQVAEDTGSRVFEREERKISEGFRHDYPVHGSPQGTWNLATDSWRQALILKHQSDSLWKERLAEARQRFRTVAANAQSQKQDAAWVYLVRCDYTESELASAVETAGTAIAFWDGPDAQTRAAQFESVRLRQRAARGAVQYWKARSQHELGRHADAIATLEGWHTEYADLPSPYPELGYDLLVQANVAGERLEAAEAAWRTLVDRHPAYKRLGNVTWILADAHNERRAILHAELQGIVNDLNRARGHRRAARSECARLDLLLAHLWASWKQAVRWRDDLVSQGSPTREADEEIRRLKARIKEVQAKNAVWSARLAPADADVRRLRDLEHACELRLYEPLLRAAGLYLRWDLALQTSMGEVDPQNVLVFAHLYWQLAQLRPEKLEHLHTARRLYTRFLSFTSVLLRSADDAEVRLANERLGMIYVHLARRK